MSELIIQPPKASFEGLGKKPSILSTVTVEDLKEKYNAFVADNTNLEKVKKHGMGWLTTGYIVELFCPDFSDKSGLLGVKEQDIYRRYTGVAKVLSASHMNEGERGKIKEGDIVLIGDDLHQMSRNPKWYDWINAQPNQVKGKEAPIEFIRKVHRFIEGGLVYLVNRGESTANTRGIEVSLETIGQFKEPLVFRVPPMDILFKITGDPWA